MEAGRLCFHVAPGNCTDMVAAQSQGLGRAQRLGVISSPADPQVQEHEQSGCCNGKPDEHKIVEGRVHP